jgi:hypothetical protein
MDWFKCASFHRNNTLRARLKTILADCLANTLACDHRAHCSGAQLVLEQPNVRGVFCQQTHLHFKYKS